MNRKPEVEKAIFKLLQENYDLSSAGDLFNVLKSLSAPILQTMIDEEFNASIGHEKHDNTIPKDNYRNGRSKKTVKTHNGEIQLEMPRDRNSEFESVIAPKYKRDISEIAEKVLFMYSNSSTTRQISETIEEIYGVKLSAGQVSQITNKIIPQIEEWQNRILSRVYPIVFVDALYYSVRVKEERRAVKKAAYVALGINENGLKEVLGIWIGETESSSFWLSVFNELKHRGVEDILIMCSDGLTGIGKAIEATFPKTVQQRCIVHLIRNSCRFFSYKLRKEFCADLKKIYNAINEEEALKALKLAKEKWDVTHPRALKCWEDNWSEVCQMFNYSKDLRKMIYTTNTIENLNSAFRKFTASRSVFNNNMSLMKCLYLAQDSISKKWKKPCNEWNMVKVELEILFEGRF